MLTIEKGHLGFLLIVICAKRCRNRIYVLRPIRPRNYTHLKANFTNTGRGKKKRIAKNDFFSYDFRFYIIKRTSYFIVSTRRSRWTTANDVVNPVRY